MLVTCPCCDQLMDVTVHEGEPAVTGGPSDSWYPGSPASIEYDHPCADYIDGLYRRTGKDRYASALDDYEESLWEQIRSGGPDEADYYDDRDD